MSHDFKRLREDEEEESILVSSREGSPEPQIIQILALGSTTALLLPMEDVPPYLHPFLPNGGTDLAPSTLYYDEPVSANKRENNRRALATVLAAQDLGKLLTDSHMEWRPLFYRARQFIEAHKTTTDRYETAPTILIRPLVLAPMGPFQAQEDEIAFDELDIGSLMQVVVFDKDKHIMAYMTFLKERCPDFLSQFYPSGGSEYASADRQSEAGPNVNRNTRLALAAVLVSGAAVHYMKRVELMESCHESWHPFIEKAIEFYRDNKQDDLRDWETEEPVSARTIALAPLE